LFQCSDTNCVASEDSKSSSDEWGDCDCSSSEKRSGSSCVSGTIDSRIAHETEVLVISDDEIGDAAAAAATVSSAEEHDGANDLSDQSDHYGPDDSEHLALSPRDESMPLPPRTPKEAVSWTKDAEVSRQRAAAAGAERALTAPTTPAAAVLIAGDVVYFCDYRLMSNTRAFHAGGAAAVNASIDLSEIGDVVLRVLRSFSLKNLRIIS
jgi:hypothetical protein